jgi:D-alanine-D-alanine ligase
MKTLLLLFGGQSSEHGVSCKSVASIIPYIDKSLFDVLVVGITKTGRGYLTEASPEEIANESWENNQGLLLQVVLLLYCGTRLLGNPKTKYSVIVIPQITFD